MALAAPAAPRRLTIDGVAVAAALATLICAGPAVTVLAFALFADRDGAQFGADLLRDGAFGTFALVALGGAGAVLFGAAAAWLVSLSQFPGRAAFEWLLVLPLAAPSYVLAYAYTGMTWANQSLLEVRGVWGAAFIYAVGLYPYVYLAARAAFVTQSASALEAARMLGAAPWRVFRQVALPLARPAIAAGGALACMEIAADYGAAQHFGLTTLSTAIFRAWYSHQSLHGALQISAVLLTAAMVLLFVERLARGRTSVAGSSRQWRPLPRYKLAAFPATAALAFCSALVLFGALLPLAWLARLAMLDQYLADVAQPFFISLALSGGGSLLTLALAVTIAVAARRAGALGRAPLLAAGMGYAAPGAVIAMSALALYFLARGAGWTSGLTIALSLAMLMWTYAARFAAAGVQPIAAGLERMSKDIDASARTLGAGPLRRLLRIDLPIAAPSLAAAALILFVEILKELPATWILRPIGFDTLATIAHAYASDDRLIDAAAPALLIFLAGLLPIVVLSRGIAHGRPGSR